MINKEFIIKKATYYSNQIRLMAVDMAAEAGKAGAHIGGSFSVVEIFSVLYGGILNFDVDNPHWENRDRFIPSKTHCILANFPALVLAGFLPRKELMSFNKDGGLLAGHPWNVDIGLEYSGGSLGMGLGIGIGMALRGRRYSKSYKTYVLIGDGESNEGSIWEAIMSAAKFGLDNLIAIFDYNNMQFDGVNNKIMPVAPLSEKLKAFGWQTVDVNGHSIEDLVNAFDTAHKNKPLAVIAHTIKAHGIPSLENKVGSHHAAITKEDYEYVKNQIEGGKR